MGRFLPEGSMAKVAFSMLKYTATSRAVMSCIFWP